MKFRPRHTANLILLFLLLNASCKKEHHSPTLPVTDSVSKSPYIVYVFGSWVDTTVYWKDGVVNTIAVTNTGSTLSISPGANYYSGAGVAASGNNVYTVGYEPNNNSAVSDQPAYWLNGAINILPDSSGDAFPSCIFVSGNDVYIGGVTEYQADTSHVPYTTPTANYPYLGSIATLWKNGAIMTLPGASYGGEAGGYTYNTHDDYVSSVYVSGNNVYVAGGSYFENYHARYWVNGTPVDLTNGLTYANSTGTSAFPNTSSIFAAGNDVYVAGYESTTLGTVAAIYWKNGVPSFLSTDSISGSVAYSIFVSGSDVYIAGYQNIDNYSRAMLWKNGTPAALTAGDTASIATAVSVAGNDVYVSGYKWVVGGHYIAAYWHNGVSINLTDGTSNAIARSVSVQ